MLGGLGPQVPSPGKDLRGKASVCSVALCAFNTISQMQMLPCLPVSLLQTTLWLERVARFVCQRFVLQLRNCGYQRITSGIVAESS